MSEHLFLEIAWYFYKLFNGLGVVKRNEGKYFVEVKHENS